MSTDGTAPLPANPGRAIIDALAQELRANDLVVATDDGTHPLITENEWQQLVGGLMSAGEVTHLQRYCLLEMICRGVGPAESGRRLRIGKSRLQRLLTGVLCDGIGEERIADRRAMVRAQFQWSIAESAKQYKATGKVEWLHQHSDDLKSLARLDGLNKAVPMEVQQTKQVAVELRVITTREQLTAEREIEQAAVGAAVQTLIAAEAATEVEAADGTEANPDDGN